MNRALRITLLIVLLLAFISTVSYCSAPFDTETARMINIRKTVSGNGYILRRETPVEQTTRGVFEPSVQDGVRVSKGSGVGIAISGNYSETLVKKLEDVTRRIEEIKKSDSFADIYASDEARIFSALRDITKEIRNNARTENYSAAAQNAHQLSTLLEKKYSAENQGAAAELLVSLEEEKYELEQQLGGIREEVTASASGYFYSALDGLEGRANEKDLFALTPSKISKFADTIKEYEQDERCVGKVVDTYSWYLAAVIPKSEASLLEEGSNVTISIDETTPVTATIAAINTDDADRSAVIVKCTRNASNIFEKRTVEFEICYEEYSGLYVPSAAIRIRDDITGVYVINRNESVSFRCVDILLQEEDYYIVRSTYTPPEEVKYASLKIYDDILVNPEAMRFNELDK